MPAGVAQGVRLCGEADFAGGFLAHVFFVADLLVDRDLQHSGADFDDVVDVYAELRTGLRLLADAHPGLVGGAQVLHVETAAFPEDSSVFGAELRVLADGDQVLAVPADHCPVLVHEDLAAPRWALVAQESEGHRNAVGREADVRDLELTQTHLK